MDGGRRTADGGWRSVVGQVVCWSLLVGSPLLLVLVARCLLFVPARTTLEEVGGFTFCHPGMFTSMSKFWAGLFIPSVRLEDINILYRHFVIPEILLVRRNSGQVFLYLVFVWKTFSYYIYILSIFLPDRHTHRH